METMLIMYRKKKKWHPRCFSSFSWLLNSSFSLARFATSTVRVRFDSSSCRRRQKWVSYMFSVLFNLNYADLLRCWSSVLIQLFNQDQFKPIEAVVNDKLGIFWQLMQLWSKIFVSVSPNIFASVSFPAASLMLFHWLNISVQIKCRKHNLTKKKFKFFRNWTYLKRKIMHSTHLLDLGINGTNSRHINPLNLMCSAECDQENSNGLLWVAG